MFKRNGGNSSSGSIALRISFLGGSNEIYQNGSGVGRSRTKSRKLRWQNDRAERKRKAVRNHRQGSPCTVLATEIRSHGTLVRTLHIFPAKHSRFHSSGGLTTASLLRAGDFGWQYVSLRQSRASLSQILVSAIRARAPHRATGCHLPSNVTSRHVHIYMYRAPYDASRIRITLSHTWKV